MEEHIKRLQQWQPKTAGEQLTKELAIKLFRQAKPKDRAAEIKHCEEAALQYGPVEELLLRERAGRKVEGWASRQSEVDKLEKQVEELRNTNRELWEKHVALESEQSSQKLTRDLLSLADDAEMALKAWRDSVEFALKMMERKA